MAGALIRPARAEELPLLGAIERNAARRFARTDLAYLVGHDPAALDFVRAVATSGIALVATVDDSVVGFSLVGFLDRAAHLHELAVTVEQGRRGIGAALLAEGEAWAAAEGSVAMTLSTFRDVAWNGPFYERLGFRHLARSEWTPALHLLHHREADAGLPVERRVFMRKELV